MANFMQRVGKKLHDLVYNNRKRYLSPEEAQAVADKVHMSVIRMNENLAWAQIQTQTEIEMIRMLPKGDPRTAHHRKKLKLRLVMQQYMEKMATSMEMVNSQIELSQMSAEMGEAFTGATQLIGTYKRDMPSFTTFVRDFQSAVGPMNEALNGGLDEMSKALDEMCDSTLDGLCSEADLDAMIYGTPKPEAAEAQPVPVEAELQPMMQSAAQPASAPAGQSSNFSDALSSIEEELKKWKSSNA